MIDHLVLATDELERTVAHVRATWGIEPTPGGAHLGRGTRNELVALGGGAYLEIIGPDLAQTDHTGERPFGVDGRTGERLVAWCARPATTIEAAARAAARLGHDVGPISSMSRRRPDGVLLAWRLTTPAFDAERPDVPAVLPFVIDWLDSPHPSTGLDHPVELVGLSIHTPDAAAVDAIVGAIGPDPRITVVDADGPPLLDAVVRTPRGEFTLRG
jgi:hypothetical protein